MEQSDFKEKVFDYVELFACEFGWSIEYSLSLPQDVVLNLLKRITKRKKSDLKALANIIAVAANCGFSGKMKPLEKMFTDIDEEDSDNIDQLRTLWSQMKKDPKALENMVKDGNITL